MNKIYKVIWSKAKNCYVVASELAKRHTKGSGARSLNRAAVTLGIVAGLTVGMTGSAWADETRVVTSVESAGTGTDFHIAVSDASLVAGKYVQISYEPISGADEPDGKITIGVNANGEINSGVTGLVTGGTVYTAITGGTLALNGSSITAVGNALVGGDLTVTGDISGKNINGIERDVTVTNPDDSTTGPVPIAENTTQTITTTENTATTTIEGVMSVTNEQKGNTTTNTTTIVDGDTTTTTTQITTTTENTATTNIVGVMSVINEHKEVSTTTTFTDGEQDVVTVQ